jgi:hypothetical protein
MKIAICLSGFLRTWEYSKPSFLKNLIQDHDCDLFIHTYKQNYFEYSSQREDIIYSEEEIMSMFEGFNVRSIVIEDRDLIKTTIEEDSRKYENINNYKIQIKESSSNKNNYVNLGIRIYDQLRKLHLCNELRKDYQKNNDVKYDFIVKTRFDMLYIDKINWDSFTNDKIIYNGNGGCGGSPDDLVGIGKEDAMNAYMDRFVNLDKMCFTTVKKTEISPYTWYDHHGDQIFPVKEFCAHDTLLRNVVYSGYDIKNGGFNNRIIRNENHILNWHDCNINGVRVNKIKITNGIVASGDNSYFDVKSFNKSL